MKKLLLALSLILCSSAAWAQNPTCPTRPTTDSSNACASTAYVQNNIVAIGPGILDGICSSTGSILYRSSLAWVCLTAGVSTQVLNSGTIPAWGGLPNNVAADGSINFTQVASPATPGAGVNRIYVGTGDQRFHDKNPAGTVGTTVVASTAPSNQFATGLSVAGVIAYTQPTYANLSGNIPNDTIFDGALLGLNVVAPGTPGAGGTRLWTDSTSKRVRDKDDAGVIGTTVVSSTAPSNQFATGLSTAGAIAYTQPAFTNLSGSLACSQHPALTGDVTSSAGVCATVLANIPTGVPFVGSLLGTNIAAPGTPAAGKTSVWTDSTSKRFKDKDDAGTIGTTVVSATAGANQFANAISTAGVVGFAQPAFSNLSGSATCAQLPALTGAVTSSAGSCATAVGSITTNILVDTANGTWTKPTGAKWVLVELCSAGGGGGSGPRLASGTASTGAGGGGGGICTQRWYSASDLGATEAYTIGAAGTAGAAISVNDTNGNAGGSGGNSTFKDLTVYGAGGGSAGSNANSTGGQGGGVNAALALGATGGIGTAGTAQAAGGAGGGGTPVATSVSKAGGASYLSASGGGSGGGNTAAPVFQAGGDGGPTANGAALAGGTTAGAAGATAAQSISASGRGAGGGAASAVGAGGAGGAGQIPGGGGGGGGASLNGSNSGAGGVGGTGWIRATSFF